MTGTDAHVEDDAPEMDPRVTPPLGPDNKPTTWWFEGSGHLTLHSDVRRPNAYLDGTPEDHHRRKWQQQSLSLEFGEQLERGDPHRVARALIVTETIQALHEAMEWVTVDGRRLADPHPVTEDGREDNAMWDWLVEQVGGVLDAYAARYPLPADAE